MRTVIFAALCALPFATQPVSAQEAPKAPAPSTYQSVVGTVEIEDLAKKSFTVKPDKALDTTVVKFDERTSFLRMPAGETDITKATKAAASDVGVGDRILARVWADSPSVKPALRFVITKQADLAQRQQKTLEDWQTQSVVGVVTAVDKSAKTATMKVRAGNAPAKDVTVDLSGKVSYEHYSPESGKYQAGDGTDIAVGDQLRTLGTKNADASGIKADAVQSGAFKTIAAQIRTIDAAGMQISAIDPTTKKPVAITVKAFTNMKRLDDQSALMLARRLNPNFQQGRGAGGAGGGGRGGGAPGGGAPGGGAPGGGGAAPGGAPGGGAAGGPPAGFQGGGGRGMGGGGGRGMDPAKVIEQQQTIQIADLKAGEPLIITGVISGDASKITAITLIAGVDPILRASPSNGADPLGGGWNFGGDGGGGGQ